MNEEFLHYIWKNKLFNKNLTTTENDDVYIIKTGFHNKDAGPDFTEARIKIGNTLWVGNIEIHVNTSDWFKHNHHKNDNYDNIILHVVYNNDTVIKRKNNEIIPTLDISNKFDHSLYSRYLSFINSGRWIACENLIGKTEPLVVNHWLDRMLIERLERKTVFLKNSLHKNKNNWEQTFYEQIARNFGFRVNTEAFECMAKSLPYKYLSKHKDNLFQLEAMLFGQAGLLNRDFTDDYPKQLKKEYQHLRNKFSFVPVNSHLWKFLRLRPSNFPTIRLSQFASLIYRSSGLLSDIFSIDNIKQLTELFNVGASSYWKDHYLFDKASVSKNKKLGKRSIHLIIINTVIPFLFTYGKQKNQPEYIDKALSLLVHLPAENNHIIKRWKSCGIKVLNAADSQALLELKDNYCSLKKCLNCNIGIHLLNK